MQYVVSLFSIQCYNCQWRANYCKNSVIYNYDKNCCVFLICGRCWMKRQVEWCASLEVTSCGLTWNQYFQVRCRHLGATHSATCTSSVTYRLMCQLRWSFAGWKTCQCIEGRGITAAFHWHWPSRRRLLNAWWRPCWRSSAVVCRWCASISVTLSIILQLVAGHSCRLQTSMSPLFDLYRLLSLAYKFRFVWSKKWSGTSFSFARRYARTDCSMWCGSWTFLNFTDITGFLVYRYLICQVVSGMHYAFKYKFLVTKPDFIYLDVSISVRRSLFSSYSGSCHGSDVTWQEIGGMCGSVCSCPCPGSLKTLSLLSDVYCFLDLPGAPVRLPVYKIVDAGQLITWLSWLAWSVKADLFCSNKTG